MRYITNKGTTVPLILFLVFSILLTCLFLIEDIREKAYIQKKSGSPTEGFGPGETKISPEIFTTAPKVEAQIVIILDDVGWNPDIVSFVKKIPVPLTLAVLPDSPFGLKIAKQLSGKQNIEILLHLPLEPDNVTSETLIAQNFLSTTMDKEELTNRLDDYFGKFGPYIVGVNNHMGSKFTRDQEKMEILLKEIKEKKLIFVDSLTTSKSVGYREAKKMQIKTAKRDIFLDNSSDPESIVKGLLLAGKIAKEKGSAIAIGHAKTVTMQVLEEKLPEMVKEGYNFVFATALAR